MHLATIELAPGMCAFYDPITGIHLSLLNRRSEVLQEMNTIGLSNAISMGRIIVIEGSLGNDMFGGEEIIDAIPTYYRLLEKKQQAELKERMFRDVQTVNVAKVSEQNKTSEENKPSKPIEDSKKTINDNKATADKTNIKTEETVKKVETEPSVDKKTKEVAEV